MHEVDQTTENMVRSVLEGVSYAMRESLPIIEQLGVPVRQIRASGGGSKSPLWRQIQADVFGQKVATINAEEGPAYGVALLAAVGAEMPRLHEIGPRLSPLVVLIQNYGGGAGSALNVGYELAREVHSLGSGGCLQS